MIFIYARVVVLTIVALLPCGVETQDDTLPLPTLPVPTLPIPQSGSISLTRLCLTSNLEEVNLSRNHFHSYDVSVETSNRTFQCSWTGIFRNPFPDLEVQLWFLSFDGFDQGRNFITVGEGDDPSNDTSIVFTRTGHQQVEGEYKFWLSKVFFRNAFWIKFEATTNSLHAVFDVSLVRNAICDLFEFPCSEGSCIYPLGVLSGYPDCPDGSDESPELGYRDCTRPEGYSYTGNQTDDSCIPWEDNRLHSDRGLSGKICRNIQDFFGGWPGCFDGNMLWVRCSIPICNIRAGCYNGTGEDYRDTGSYTENGYRCINWSQIPSDVFDVQLYTDADLSSNYCRNPNGQERPWCYYQDVHGNLQQAFCDINVCQGQTLTKFLRVPMATFDLAFSEHSDLQNSNFDVFTEEDCADTCLRENSFTCRSFVFTYEGKLGFGSKTCSWSTVAPTSHQPDILEFDEGTDVFVRLETVEESVRRRRSVSECDSFLVTSLPDFCPLPLGLTANFYSEESGQTNVTAIQDEAITASSYLGEEFHPRFVRYNSDSCWKYSSDDRNPWIQVDFEGRHIITGIVLQGCSDGAFATQFTVQSKRSDNAFITHRDRTTGRMALPGNVNANCHRIIEFDPWIYAESLRIRPILRDADVGIRFELLGCKDDCEFTLGLTDLRLFDAAITASSILDEDHSPRNARIQPLELQLQPSLGWSPDLVADNGVPSWIQVSFQTVNVVKAVITQGCSESDSFLESFTVDYTPKSDADDADDIIPYTSPRSQEYMIFRANTDSESVTRNDLPYQILARFVRLNAISWGGSGRPCMKLELVGCENEVCGQSLGIGRDALRDVVSVADPSSACIPETYELHGRNTFSFSSAVSSVLSIVEGYIEITLPEEYTITGVISQGAILISTGRDQSWATNFRLLYSRIVGDGNDFVDRPYLTAGGTPQVFDANYDSITPVFNELDRPVAATKVTLIVYNVDEVSTNSPCVRFDLVGCKVSEKGYPCGSSAQNLDGYCTGSVQSDDFDACTRIFQSTSNLAVLRQRRTLEAVNNNFQQLAQPGYSQYLIGLIHVQEEDWSFYTPLAPFIWLDGTPLLYVDFFDPHISYENSTEELCVTIDLTDQLTWKPLPCNSATVVPASLCQFDIDECLQDTFQCSHGCINYPGGYQCSCPEGTYLEPGPNQESCLSFCGLLGLSSSPSLPDLCFEFHTASTYGMAIQECGLTGKRLMTADELLTVATEWTGAFPVSRTWLPRNRADTSCSIAQLVLLREELETSSFPCRGNVSFICVQDILPETFELFTSPNTTNYTVSDTSLYITWTGLPPWYGILTSANLVIRVEDNFILRLHFVYFRLRRAQGAGCLDTMVLWEHLPGGRSRRQGDYCGTLSDFDIETSTNRITLSLSIGDFETNMEDYLTMQLLYEARDCTVQECNLYCASADQNYTAPEGQLQTFNFPEILPPYYSCSWTILLQKGSFVRLQFLELNIVCTARHFVNIFSTRRPNRNQLDRRNSAILCANTEALTISETNSVLITYDTGLSHQSNGFHAVYETSDYPGCRLHPKEGMTDMCVDTICDQFAHAYIASPNYPMTYGRPLICRWTISTKPGTFISLQLLDFDIPDEMACMREFLAVEDPEQIVRYCNANRTVSGGVVTMPTYYSSQNRIFLRFSSIMGKFLALYKEEHFEPTTSLVLSSDADYRCRNADWHLFNKRCYQIRKAPTLLRWTEAVSNCERLDNQTQAASIRNVGEANFIHNLILTEMNETSIFYIGLFTSIDDPLDFSWTDGSPLSYTDWYNRDYNYDEIQPDGGVIESCSAIKVRNFGRTDNWFDVPCAAKTTDHYICAQPAITDAPLAPSENRISFSRVDCHPGYYRLARQCLRLVPLNSSVDSQPNVGCPSEATVATKAFVLSTLGSFQFYLTNIWSVPEQEIEIQLTGPNQLQVSCFEKLSPRGFQLKTGRCNASRTFALCTVGVIDIQQNCSENQFRCDSGECINSVFVCDFTLDCSDGSDEQTCDQGGTIFNGDSEVACGRNHFQCRDESCIQTSFVCDFVLHCPDGSDEDNCTFPECQVDEFLCENKQCIPQENFCNLVPDCADGSDERTCVSSEGNFQCYSSIWLPRSAYCDGQRDCFGQGFEDEPPECDYFQSSFRCTDETQIKCRTGRCVNQENLCRFDKNQYGLMQGCRDTTHLQTCEKFECTHLTYKCPNSYCIPQRYRCNGVPDCPGKEDEIGCNRYVCSGAYKCRRSQSCLTQRFVCDGIRHCPEGDDELFCGTDCPDNCTCSGLIYSCSSVTWSLEHVTRIPKNVKLLSLSNLQLSQRRKRQTMDDNVTIYDATLLNIHEFSLLYFLELSSNGITDLGNGTFSSNLNLHILNLSYNGIIGLNSMTFTGLDNLRVLDLQGNPLTDVRGSPFQNLQLLTFLSIQSSDVIVSSSDFVAGLDSIEIFWSERFYYCCLLEESTTLQECLPEADEFSSCTDLIRSIGQRVMLWIMSASALSGNVIVIVLRIRKRKDTSKSRGSSAQPIFVMNLAIADLLMGCYLLMIAIADTSYRGRYGLFSDIWQTSFFCRFAGFLSTISSVTSVIFLTVISIDRYQSVLYPLSPKRLRANSAIVISISVWIAMMVISVLPTIIFSRNYYGRSSVCLALPITADRPSGWLYSFLVFIVLSLLLFLVMLICYIGIFIIAKRSTKFSTSLSKSEQQLKEEQLQIAVKVFMLVASDFFCWMPIIIMGFLALTPAAVSGDIYAWTAIFILPINSAVNPHLYTFIIERSQRKESKVATSRDTDNTGLITPDSSPAIQRLRLQKGGTAGTQESAKSDESGVVKLVLSAMRSNRVLAPAVKDRYLKYQLSTLKSDPKFQLTNEDKEDIITDVGKALTHLHNTGVSHGNVNEEHVIIDELQHGNKRAYLLMAKPPITTSSLKKEKRSSDSNGIELKDIKISGSQNDFSEDKKQYDVFSLKLRSHQFSLSVE